MKFGSPTRSTSTAPNASRIARFIDDVKAFDAENIPEQDVESKFSSRSFTRLSRFHIHAPRLSPFHIMNPVWQVLANTEPLIRALESTHSHRDVWHVRQSTSWRLESWGHLNYESMKSKSQAVLSLVNSYHPVISYPFISSDHFLSLYILLS